MPARKSLTSVTRDTFIKILEMHVPRDEHLATDTEKDQYAKIIKLHLELPKIFRHAANDEDAADALAAVIDFHIGEAKNSNTNTIKYTIISFIPLDPKKDMVDPPITGSGKDN
ncbi:hypothetical protein B0H34DRAFT_676396 [Crassisporium funariophilum]|nr:hypothetical protein B0H34DRAFT_676396 [Crassisporium funariophilum]